MNDLAEYISISNQLAAKSLVKNIFDKVDRLETFPGSGKTPIELSNLSYREILVKPCRIFYKIEANKTYILYMMRQERALRKLLLIS
ncbi:type II toxin-antitoxin system RelE/ParE family toxin [Motilimonas cestriensis]|uniref:Type II toxin-antitoxin system RelE/ParE family toxin n=1 Tax=Motilimonas cestriensis TaxID=2742685 RepID=A0ABS8WBG0_9GAMM|nr:type II toxin-antitoxin system RelE/ParE family toxin [Motilimonas cestriensis]MCE2596354.1 type II toxin-antitoxin system RelE/ParE family toxin [Motilimonas cestriensis]